MEEDPDITKYFIVTTVAEYEPSTSHNIFQINHFLLLHLYSHYLIFITACLDHDVRKWNSPFPVSLH